MAARKSTFAQVTQDQWEAVKTQIASTTKHIEITNHEMGAVQTEVTTIKSDVSILKSSFECLDKNIAVIQSKMEGLEAGQKEMKTVMEEYRSTLNKVALTAVVSMVGFILIQFFFHLTG
jgi:chromosome segregation ATPase